MAKQKISRASKTRLVVFGSICGIVISYFIINTFSMLLNIKKLSAEQHSLENNLVQLQEDEINLTKELSKLKNDEYKARYAREYFLYSKENGEYIFANILDDEENNTSVNDNQNNLYHYVIAAVIIVLLFIVLFIIKRIKKINKD